MFQKTYQATHPSMIAGIDNETLSDLYLVTGMFEKDQVRFNCSHNERMVVGGGAPVTKAVDLLVQKEQVEAAPLLERRELGVVNVASLLSFQGGIRVASCTASKSGLAGLTRLLANEWAAKGINVNAIVPAYFATNNTGALRNDRERNGDILARIPAGRWGDPDDLGGAVVYLASSASDYVHGAMLPVDGGWLAR
jgi:NAD(P)-dependent dehydrogenase (short-subunit alcohol dehydrogenase family)